ncbi:HNH endonuclease [Mycoplasmopsis agalactiae]|nr:HNH endonuclease [Mycoplasmopsis agalactiae]MCE6090541.1 HNH endonuclease [Mycoplasmopsis agalactiae]
MRISEIINSSNIRQLFFAFFNLGKELDKEFEIKITYKNSKHANMQINNRILTINNNKMCAYLELNFNIVNQSHVVYLINDLNYTRQKILSSIYRRIQQLRFEVNSKEFDNALFLNLFAFRGSVDLVRNYYSVDLLKYNMSIDYADHLLSLFLSTSAIKQLNLNFRELQPDFINNKKRNTQIRVNLRWFYDHYFNELGNINIYKQVILMHNSKHILLRNVAQNYNNSFINRLIFYRYSILETGYKSNKMDIQLSEKQISDFRSELDFDINEDVVEYRNTEIVKIARLILPDECSACKEKYNILDRTFIHRQTQKPYLEIHHVISFGSGNKSDVLENLVKLCPACHKALSKNRANEDYQKQLIHNIISSNSFISKYLENFVDNDIINEKIEFVYSNLM